MNGVSGRIEPAGATSPGPLLHPPPRPRPDARPQRGAPLCFAASLASVLGLDLQELPYLDPAAAARSGRRTRGSPTTASASSSKAPPAAAVPGAVGPWRERRPGDPGHADTVQPGRSRRTPPSCRSYAGSSSPSTTRRWRTRPRPLSPRSAARSRSRRRRREQVADGPSGSHARGCRETQRTAFHDVSFPLAVSVR